MRRALKIFAKFAAALAIMTIISTAVWQEVVRETIYDCTDAFGFDYLQPGTWVHGDAAAVHQVVHHCSMCEPDTLKEGWAVSRLWSLWYLFVLVSFAASILFALVPSNPKRWRITRAKNRMLRTKSSRHARAKIQFQQRLASAADAGC
jgi:hypothetical protein